MMIHHLTTTFFIEVVRCVPDDEMLNRVLFIRLLHLLDHAGRAWFVLNHSFPPATAFAVFETGGIPHHVFDGMRDS